MYVSAERLLKILRDELSHAITELGCHPGYYDPAFQCVYHQDREHELRTLCDPRLREFLNELEIELIGYRQLPEAISRLLNTWGKEVANSSRCSLRGVACIQ